MKSNLDEVDVDSKEMRFEYTRLNVNAVTKDVRVLSSEEALKDVTPIDWSDSVLSGEKKVVIKYGGNKQ